MDSIQNGVTWDDMLTFKNLTFLQKTVLRVKTPNISGYYKIKVYFCFCIFSQTTLFISYKKHSTFSQTVSFHWRPIHSGKISLHFTKYKSNLRVFEDFPFRKPKTVHNNKNLDTHRYSPIHSLCMLRRASQITQGPHLPLMSKWVSMLATSIRGWSGTIRLSFCDEKSKTMRMKICKETAKKPQGQTMKNRQHL